MANITLEVVEEAFCIWRNKRGSKSELIPKNLWSMALGLYPQYQRSKICQRLRLSGSQFKRHLEARCLTVANHGFVLASKAELTSNFVATPEVQLTIQGKERSLNLCISVHELSQILPQIGMLL
jgi:hypothetical protein